MDSYRLGDGLVEASAVLRLRRRVSWSVGLGHVVVAVVESGGKSWCLDRLCQSGRNVASFVSVRRLIGGSCGVGRVFMWVPMGMVAQL